MKIKISKVLSLSLVAMLASAMMVGCGSDTSNATTSTTTPEVVVPENPPVEDVTPDMGVEDEFDFEMPEVSPLADPAIAMMDTIFGEGAGQSMMHMSDAEFINDMLGLELPSDVVVDFVYSTPMINVNYQTFFAIQAQDGKVADAEAILTRFREDEIMSVGPPDPYAHVDSRHLKAQAAQIVTIGDVVYYIAMGDTAELGDEPTLDEVSTVVDASVELLKETVEGGADAVVAPDVDLSALPQVGDMGGMMVAGEGEGEAPPAGDMTAPNDGEQHLGQAIPEFSPEQYGG